MKTMNDAARFLSSFLLTELPVIQNQSTNTISSYRDTYIRLLEYMAQEKGIRPDRLSVSDLTSATIGAFLNWLETERGNTISTRNQRLAAIHSLFRYIQIQAPEYMFQCQQVLAVPFKKAEKKLVGYLSEDDTRKLLSAPNVSKRRGRRDQALLSLLYDSGARVQELADLKVKDIRLEPPAQVLLTGKGRKSRSVPLMDKTCALIKQYLKENYLDDPRRMDFPLFFNQKGQKLTRQGIAYIVKKYAQKCGIEEISPHRLRHTKAMHLTEADVNPIYIRDFLGHTDLKVTEIYSKTSVKMKKAALDKLNSSNNVIPEEPTREWSDDQNLMEWLAGLGQ